MAKVRKRGDSYVVDYYFRGRRIRKAVGPSRRVAEDILKDIEGRRVRDDAGLAVLDVSAEQALAEFLEDRKARNSPKQVKHQERVVRDLIDFAGVRKIRQLAPRTIERWQQKRAAKTSKATARGNLVTVRTWLRWAKRAGYLQSDPSDQVKKLPLPARGEIKFLSAEEADALLVACLDPVPFHGRGKKGRGTSRPRKTPLYEMAAVAMHAGLRVGEILNLQWEDVELDGNRGVLHVRVRDSFVPKDKEGRRIPLHSRLRMILRAYRKKAGQRDGLMFQTSNGTVFESRNVVRELQKAADRAGIEGGCNFTLLRHTFASWLTMAEVPLHHISKFLGHSSVTTTEKHYAGLAPEMLHGDIEKIGKPKRTRSRKGA